MLPNLSLSPNAGQVSYDGAWEALKAIDEDPADASRVRLVYSNFTHAKADQGLSTGWNREHSWPRCAPHALPTRSDRIGCTPAAVPMPERFWPRPAAPLGSATTAPTTLTFTRSSRPTPTSTPRGPIGSSAIVQAATRRRTPRRRRTRPRVMTTAFCPLLRSAATSRAVRRSGARTLKQQTIACAHAIRAPYRDSAILHGGAVRRQRGGHDESDPRPRGQRERQRDGQPDGKAAG